MKRHNLFLQALFLILIFAVQAFAQADTTITMTVARLDKASITAKYESVPIDSGSSIMSQEIKLFTGFSYATNPLTYSISGTDSDSNHVSVYWYENIAGDWVKVDTICTVTTATAAMGTFNLNNRKSETGKIVIFNDTGAKADTLNFGFFQDYCK